MKTCSLCGTSVSDDVAFCANCGQSTANTATQSEAAAPSMDGAAAASAPQSQPTPPVAPQAQPVYQQPYAQPMYPMYQQYAQEPVTMGEWMLNMLLCAIPVVNIVMLCVWAFGSGAKLSLRNWARASLVWVAIGVVLWILLLVLSLGIIGASGY